MKKKTYSQLDEIIYSKVLDNGLTVKLLPKPTYNKTYALFSTDFGSIDQHFVPLGKKEPVMVPDGIAHFLEHKLFEKKDRDVFHDFSKYGAAANAFTSFTKTAYLFSTTDYVSQNLKVLLDFVQDPYFTAETVEKEKGIIAQEIQMYDDHPDWRLMFGLLQNMYPDHPVHIDIAGTVESIDKITHEMLYENYYTFYHPSNMTLFMVGNFDEEKIMTLIEKNQNSKSFDEASELKRFIPEEDFSQFKTSDEISMDIIKPKVAIGIRGKEHDRKGKEALKFEASVKIFLKMILGSSSNNFLELYDDELVDDSFSYSYESERSFNYINVSSDTQKPEAFEQKIKEILLTGTENKDFNKDHFDEVKKSIIGKHLQSLNSLEFIAYQFIEIKDDDATIFDTVPLIESITFEDVKNAAESIIDEDLMSVFKVLPK